MLQTVMAQSVLFRSSSIKMSGDTSPVWPVVKWSRQERGNDDEGIASFMADRRNPHARFFGQL
jgi:hypothetical protein